MDVTKKILRNALGMARALKARAILVYADVFAGVAELAAFLEESAGQMVVVVTRERETYQRLKETSAQVILVPAVRLTRLGQIKIAVLLGLSRSIFEQGDRLICLTGISADQAVDTMVFLEVGEEYEIFSMGEHDGEGAQVNPLVFERVLDIAVALGSQGREGKPVGTIFVLGDTENVLTHSTPLVLNPFHGHSEEKRNVLDPALTETVKEFSAIDGAFVIRGDGLIEAAGVYLKPSEFGEQLPWGLGTRHKSAAGITATTSAVAVAVSASTGTVTVFRNGKILIEVERLKPIGSISTGKGEA
ncbi:hypothetical protein DESUT3_33080 [Desulfuromonas versatilis]|uniref:DAC domain-containing protein n=1 Tax=Desulfuromonas versatilis TaxID=2802975 RepID=A0ABM8HW51_9BACT|nr:diadenylate cyclase [Desulfuromonas versatilis]BCR06239.1 hypothetical protein DESUT3_33080 [Desulfuromonas versatilis]